MDLIDELLPGVSLDTFDLWDPNGHGRFLRLFNLLPGEPFVLALVAESVVEYLLYCCLEGPASDGSYGRLGGTYSDDMGV